MAELPPADQAIEQAATTEEQAAVAEQAAAQIEVTLLLPHQSFVKLPHLPSPASSTEFLELPIPLSLTDAVHELRQMIVESPEAFWLGAFGFVPVVADALGEPKEGEEQKWGPWTAMTPPEVDEKAGPIDPKIWRLTDEGVLGDFADMGSVFGGSFERQKKGLKVVVTSFSHLVMSLHLLRLRDTLYSTLPALNSSTYDPTSVAVAAGSTLYSAVRGESEDPEAAARQAEEESEANASKNGKKGNKASKKAVVLASVAATAEPATPADQTHAFTNWHLEDLNPYSAFDHLKPASSPSLATPCFRAFGVSAWSPPPHARRMRGDLVYLTATTLEGESFHITGATSGFWVSKSTSSTFDPLPKTPAPRGLRSTPYHSLFELFSALSAGFLKGLVHLIEAQNPSHPTTDIYSTLAITNSVPAAPWLVPAPVHTSDPFRTQIAYLLTSTTNAELLPPARDWNDEFAQYKELPTKTIPERLLRERLISRVHADFVSAATRGALSIARGDVPPLNPSEPQEAHTYIHNNMLFTRADDAIKAFGHVGGNEAAHVAAGKDLAGINLLEKLNVQGVNTMATVLVDFCGERWIVQTLIPGLFKTKESEDEAKKDGAETKEVEVYPVGDEEAKKAATDAAANDKPFPSIETANKDDYPPTGVFRIVYGSSNPELPDENVRASAYFHQLAKKVADEIHLEEHDVKNAEGKTVKLWTSTDMHGIAAPDGRSYFIDCFRLHCVDVEFLENNLTGPLFHDATASEANGVHSPADYPHRLVLLRPELLETYRDSKLQAWIEARVLEARAKISAEAEKKTIAAGSVESELKEAATEGDAPVVDEAAARAAPSIILATDYHLSFNPDAFVERKPSKDGETATVIYDPEAESTKAVRDASVWLRKTVLPGFVHDIVSSVLVFTDGPFLTKLMHRKGINMRYLGMLADLVEVEGPKMDFGTVTKPDSELALNALKQTLQHEMVSRSAKHILNRLLRSATPYDHPSVVAHFYNCLLGANLEVHPVAELVDLPAGVSSKRTWTSLTPASLRTQLLAEVETRYRYALPSSFFATVVPSKLLREVCLRVGVQLLLRQYDFGSASSGSDAAPSDEEKVESASKKSKKSKGKKADAGKPEDRQLVSVRPEDVINILPVLKVITIKSGLSDDNFIAGNRAMSEGNTDLGQDLIHDSLQLCEQIFGSIHAEAASKYHSLGLIYHTLSQTILRKVSMHNAAMDAMVDLAPEHRAAATKQFEELLLPDVDAVKAEGDHYVHLATRMIRQSLIIAERTLGIDSPDTIQQYSDLGLLEQAIGNSIVALRLTKHALYLWTTAYGPNHPTTLNLLTNAASMIQSEFGPLAAVPLLRECLKLAKAIYGERSTPYAATLHQIAQALAMGGEFVGSVVESTETCRIFTEVLGAEAKETIEATEFLNIIKDAVQKEGQERQAQAERLRQKAPRLTNEKEVRSKGVAGEKEVEEIVVKKEHGQKANLSVDELVSFIQGTPLSKKATPARKRKASPGAVVA